MLKRPRRDRPGNRFRTPSFCLNRNDKGADNMPNRAQQIYKQEFRFGLGGVSLGNEFNKHTDKEAEGTLEAAWEVGVRCFDVAPWYGFGLAARRVRGWRSGNGQTADVGDHRPCVVIAQFARMV